MQLRSPLQFDNDRFLMFVIDEMAYEYEKTYDDVIRMTLGKSELPVCDSILDAMDEALHRFDKSTLVFPAGLPELRERIAQEYQRRYGLSIAPKNVVISVGTSTVFRNLYYLLANDQDEILLPKPYYPLYQFCASLIGATVKYYDIDLETMRLDVESLRANFSDRTKIVVLNSPGNPLGNTLTRDELYAIDEVVSGRATIISDEIYSNVCFDAPHVSLLELNDLKSPVIITNSFSKGFRMYSRRVGYCIVPDELVTPLTVIQHHTLLTTDPIPQFGAIAALDNQSEVEYIADLYKSRRDYTLEQFASVPNVRAIPAEGSFYLTLDCAAFMEQQTIPDCLRLAEMIMEQTHVATVPGSDFGLPLTLRLSYSSKRYNEGIDRLAAFFKNYQS